MAEDNISVIVLSEYSEQSIQQVSEELPIENIRSSPAKNLSNEIATNQSSNLPKINNLNKEMIELKTTTDITSPSSLNLLHIFSVLGSFAQAFCPMSLIPWHNSIVCPEYWYEVYIAVILAMGFSSATIVTNCYVFMKEKVLTSFWVISKVWMVYVVGFIVPSTMSYLIWTTYLGYNHPMPFVGFCQFISWLPIL